MFYHKFTNRFNKHDGLGKQQFSIHPFIQTKANCPPTMICNADFFLYIYFIFFFVACFQPLLLIKILAFKMFNENLNLFSYFLSICRTKSIEYLNFVVSLKKYHIFRFFEEKKRFFEIFWDCCRFSDFWPFLTCFGFCVFFTEFKKKMNFFWIFLTFLEFWIFWILLTFFGFLIGLFRFLVFPSMLLRLLLKVTKVTIGHQKLPKMGHIKFFFKGPKTPRPKAEALPRS